MVSESDSMVDLPVMGNLTYREWHGFLNGFYSGARWGSRQHEYEKEKHYWRGGYLLGTAIRYTLLIAVYLYLTNDSRH
jgi:hypothetical protein